jgi:hypothetical protein
MQATVDAFAAATEGISFADRIDVSVADGSVGVVFVREGDPEVIVAVLSDLAEVPPEIAERYVRGAEYAFARYDDGA